MENISDTQPNLIGQNDMNIINELKQYSILQTPSEKISDFVMYFINNVIIEHLFFLIVLTCIAIFLFYRYKNRDLYKKKYKKKYIESFDPSENLNNNNENYYLPGEIYARKNSYPEYDEYSQFNQMYNNFNNYDNFINTPSVHNFQKYDNYSNPYLQTYNDNPVKLNFTYQDILNRMNMSYNNPMNFDANSPEYNMDPPYEKD